MEKNKNIALVAHDNRKKDLIEWFEYNYRSLVKHKLVCTGTTGRLIEEALQSKLGDEEVDYQIVRLKSGPLVAVAESVYFCSPTSGGNSGVKTSPQRLQRKRVRS